MNNTNSDQQSTTGAAVNLFDVPLIPDTLAPVTENTATDTTTPPVPAAAAASMPATPPLHAPHDDHQMSMPATWLRSALSSPTPHRQTWIQPPRSTGHVIDSPGAWRDWMAETTTPTYRTPPAPTLVPTPASARLPQPHRHHRRRMGLIILITAAVAAPAAALAVALSTTRLTSPVAPPAASAECDHSIGSQSSGPEVIRAFQRAYYVTRSGAAARAVVAASAAVPDATAIQAGVDTLAAGTSYCVTITPPTAGVSRVGTWRVLITQTTPRHRPLYYRETVTCTRTDHDRWSITSITSP